ncbi:MAG TPA: ABC transporter substrate-binding protein [Chthoniobacterales bacterium]|nr:ABC transporter substrate-binding protein [Chthoniobacterales bacterium]
MRTSRTRRRALLLSVVLPGMCAFALAAGESAPSERSAAISRGRQIYLTGVPANGAPLTASVGNPAMEVPASILKCVNCHGSDGRGKAEGGVTPANIRWEELTKPSAGGPAGRRRSAYSEKLLVRAIAVGIDASGNRLDPAMPHYRLTHEQAADLVAYLEVLGREADPGVTENALKIGVVLPPAGGPGSAQRIREVVAAFALQVNEQGGFYGRRLQFAFTNAPAEVAARAGAIRDFVESEQPFVLISSYVTGCEQEIGRYLDENKVPLIGAIALNAADGPAQHRYVFHLLAGLPGQGKALARFATQRPESKHSGALLVYREGDDAIRAAKETIGKCLIADGWPAPRDVILTENSAPDWSALLRGGSVDAVFWFAPAGGLDQLYRAASTVGSYPFLFAPNVLTGPALLSAPPGFAGRIFCSFPTLPSDQTSAGRSELLKLAGEPPVSDSGFSRMALSSVKLLAHGLRQAGKEVSREKLVEILENLYGYSTEQTPAVTFTQNRRIGADGVHVVGIDVQRKSVVLPSTWVPLN